MGEWSVGDVWYGKVDSGYENVKATIIRVTAKKIYVLFDRQVGEDKGRQFLKSKFKRLFSESGQMDMFTDRW